MNRLLLVTDAWKPQVNGVVTTLVELVAQLQHMGLNVLVVHPGLFKTRPCPGYDGIDLAIQPYAELARLADDFRPDWIHLATEGPLGWAARRYCNKRGFNFSTAFHTKFPEILNAALKIPLSWGYALFRYFHSASSAVMVPTSGVQSMLHDRKFKRLKAWTHGVDMELFEYAEKPTELGIFQGLPRPLSLFVGRLSYEKNIQAFLEMDVPGTKVVCGVGPLQAQLRARYPQVCWLGVLPRDELATVYAAADVFVFPSRNETFGLVMLEAMACGTPVAAYPVDGPLQVLGPNSHGGVLDQDLTQATLQALTYPRSAARVRAEMFGWPAVAEQFVGNLVLAQSH
ncbi:glycosyltransferase family 1 protein [Limnohabitans sp.]|mgnify:CR=1 FL=1|jgi:glycosyltransferase involved in cell wall biosynthesis|uniref:glycosyltransferase family 4 protein n=1 Tax=Limnohabitans sp. TaxID=1907725 RepID=UPI00311E0E83